jgi:hypothetical protein
MDAYLAGMRREEQFAELVLAYRDRLQAAYDVDVPAEEKRRRKEEIFAELKEAYRELRASWGGARDYDGWFERDLNNAHLVSVGAYHEYVPGFERLAGGLRRRAGVLLRHRPRAGGSVAGGEGGAAVVNGNAASAPRLDGGAELARSSSTRS